VKMPIKSDQVENAVYHHTSHGPLFGAGLVLTLILMKFLLTSVLSRQVVHLLEIVIAPLAGHISFQAIPTIPAS